MKLLKIREITTMLEEKIISLGENDLFRIYAIWKNTKLGNAELIENIIKVQLPSNIEEAKKILLNGLKYSGKTYISLLTTPSLMKHEDTQLDYKCEYFFIAKEEKEFIDVLEDVASLGKIKDKYNTQLCINKDIVSRLGLLASTGDSVYIPNFKKAILPEMTYTYIANYLQFAEKEGNIDLENLRLEEHKELKVEHNFADGCGFMSPSLAEEIQKKLHKDYPIDFAVIRELGTATKGLIVRFNWKEYLKQEHGLSKLIVKDFWGNAIDLFKVDIILNATQVKWAKWFNNAEEIETLKKNYKNYYRLLNSLTITKVNKKNPKDYTLSNYQILSNLNLTEKELQELSKDTEDIYKKVIDKDIDATRILLGDIAREDLEVLSASTKIHKLLQLDEKLINIETAKRTVNSMLNKKVHQLAGGKLYLKGRYNMLCADPILYFSNLINAEYKDNIIIARNTKNGLKAKTNYISGEQGNRVLARCPLNSATELIKTNLVNSNIHNKYLGNLTTELIFFGLDNNLMLMSGADCDGDLAFAINNKTIYNAVIGDIDQNGVHWNFRNQFDGGTYKCLYIKENVVNCVLENAGNSIGQLSNIGAKISNKIQEYTYLVNNKYYTYADLKEAYSKKKTSVDNKEFNTFLDRLTKKDKIIDYAHMTEKERKNATLQLFNKHKIYSYYTLFLQMVAIDSVKTGKKVDKEMESVIKDYKKLYKPEYIYHAKWTSGEHKPSYDKHKWSNSLLCNNAKRINKLLGYKTREEVKYSDKHLFNAIYNKDLEDSVNLDLVRIIEDLHIKYNLLRKEVRKNFNTDNFGNREFNKIDIIIAEKWDKLIKDKYSTEDVCMALCKAKVNGYRCSSRFILMFAWNIIMAKLIKKSNGVGTAYKKVAEEDADFKYFFRHWKKVCIDLDTEDNLGEKEIIKKKEKLGSIVKIRIKNLTQEALEKITEIKVQEDKVINKNGQLLGILYPDFINKVKNMDYNIDTVELDRSKKGMSIYLIA